MRRSSEAALRNRGPILDVLRRYVIPGDRVLEIASGSGQHAVWLSPRLGVTWQPSDPDPAARASIDAWRVAPSAEVGGADGAVGGQVLPALIVDVHSPGVHYADVLYNMNMVHIAPWSAAIGLLDLAASLRPRTFFLYGPFRRNGTLVASNMEFDAWLRARDPEYGVRDLEKVVSEAELRGLQLLEVVEMPANNLSVVFRFP